MQKPANDHSFESGVLEKGNISNMQDRGYLRTRVENYCSRLLWILPMTHPVCRRKRNISIDGLIKSTKQVHVFCKVMLTNTLTPARKQERATVSKSFALAVWQGHGLLTGAGRHCGKNRAAPMIHEARWGFEPYVYENDNTFPTTAGKKKQKRPKAGRQKMGEGEVGLAWSLSNYQSHLIEARHILTEGLVLDRIRDL